MGSLDSFKFEADGALKRMMKINKDIICQHYISHMNKTTSSLPLIEVISDTPTKAGELQPSPTQVIHKSYEDNVDVVSDADSTFAFSHFNGGLNKLSQDQCIDTLYTQDDIFAKDTEESRNKLTSRVNLNLNSDNSQKLSDEKNEKGLKDLENFIDGAYKERLDTDSNPGFHTMYERFILQLKLEIKSLHKIIDSVNASLRNEVSFLREQINMKDKITTLLLNQNINSKKTGVDFNTDYINTDYINNNAFINTDNNKNPLKHDKYNYNGYRRNNANDETFINKQTFNNKNSESMNCINSSQNQANELSSNVKQTEYYELIGDSHFNNIHENGLRKENRKVNIRRWSGGGTQDMMDLVKPVIRKKPSEIIIHTGCNDLTNNINPLTNIKKIVKLVKEASPDIKLTFSSIMTRKDAIHVTEKVIVDCNNHLKNYCQQNNLGFIDNSNIDETCLGKRKLHMGKKGTSMLAKNILNHMNHT